MMREGPIVGEPQYICDVCGRKKPVSQMAGKCVACGKYVCSQCAVLSDDRVYCAQHAPKKGCFIATAAFGTPMAAEINILRQFRDKELESNLMGRQFVRLYYNLSPPIADVIARNEDMRAWVRLNLSPIIKAFKTKYQRESNQR